jgi:protoheme IX farnesyltransferase
LGWASARGEVDGTGWSLFLILFCWQVPHFMAIAWIYREDYARAGFVMVPMRDPSGMRTAWHGVGFGVALVLASVVPYGRGIAGMGYLVGALCLGLGLVGCALSFMGRRDEGSARRLFRASILYLPLLLGLLVLDKLS